MNDDDSVTDKYGHIFEINGAIVQFTREKIIEIQGLAELHRTVAEKYDGIAEQLAELATESARLIGDALAVEMGLGGEDEEGDNDD